MASNGVTAFQGQQGLERRRRIGSGRRDEGRDHSHRLRDLDQSLFGNLLHASTVTLEVSVVTVPAWPVRPLIEK